MVIFLQAPVLVAQSDRDQYDYLLSIVDPGKRMGPDEEALLAVGDFTCINSEIHTKCLRHLTSFFPFDSPDSAEGAIRSCLQDRHYVSRFSVEQCMS